MKKAFAQAIVSTAFLGMAAALTGCASGAVDGCHKEQIVEQRAQERLNHLKGKNYNQAYAYLTPSYRSVVSAESYSNQFGKKASGRCNGQKAGQGSEERCTVNVELKVPYARGFGGETALANLVETWLKEDGQWWFYQKD